MTKRRRRQSKNLLTPKAIADLLKKFGSEEATPAAVKKILAESDVERTSNGRVNVFEFIAYLVRRRHGK